MDDILSFPPIRNPDETEAPSGIKGSSSPQIPLSTPA